MFLFISSAKDVFETFLEKVAKEMRLLRPYTAIHIRRGDKIGTEAERHELWEYLAAALQLVDEAPTPERRMRVFIATDDPSVLVEARKSYSKHFDFICLPQAADLAAKVNKP